MAMMQTNDPRLTTGQAARELKLSTQRIRQLADAGVLASVVTPLGRLVDAESVAAFRSKRAAAPVMKSHAQ